MRATTKRFLLLCALAFSSACAVDDSSAESVADGDPSIASHEEALLAVPPGQPVCVLTTYGAPGEETGYLARNWRSGVRQPLLPVVPTPEPGTTTILPGTCGSQSSICLAIANPVCATVNLTGPATYSNRCALRAAVLVAAGSTGSARGSVTHKGACGVACLSSDSCAKGEYCTVEDGVCNRPPGCRPDAICPAVCAGECAPLATE